MKRYNYFFAVLLAMLVASCMTATKPAIESSPVVIEEEEGYQFTPPKENRLKGTNTEIMNAFKTLLSRYELEAFEMASLRIATKHRVMDNSSAYYEKYKRSSDIYEQYQVQMKREGYEMVVDIKYLILTKELNMKTGKIYMKEIARITEKEDELLEKVKRYLYQY